jgi:selenide,water dikinase
VDRTARPRPHVVLIGAGTAHLALLAGKAMGKWLGDADVTLVSPSVTVLYTGMLPASLAGECTRAAVTIELPTVCRAAGVRFVCGRAEHVDVTAGAVAVTGRRAPLRYDALALAPGAETRGDPGDAVPVRPLDGLFDAVERWRHEKRRTIAVVGAGASGAEIAVALAGRGFAVTLFERSARVLPEMAPSVTARFGAALARAGVVVRTGVDVGSFRGGTLETRDGSQAFDGCVWATGPAPSSSLPGASTALPLDAEGYLRVDATLRVVGTANVFGTGDGVTIEGQRPRRNGVAAVRQGQVLGRNLDRLFERKPLRPFRLRRPTLWILNAGCGDAVAGFGRWSWRGRLARRLKSHLDARWMRRWARPAPRATDMPCDGCGGKAPAQALRAVLPPSEWEDVGLWSDRGTALAGSIDTLTSWTDDGELFAFVAVLHALSDVYAKGLRADAALVSVTLPRLPSPSLERLFEEVDRGARAALDQENVRLVAGHTAQGERLALGVAVVAAVGADSPVFRKNALDRGDVLCLTKPLGTGIALAAWAQGACPAATWTPCVHWMGQSNRRASERARALGVRAATDVTGFGLAVAALEMAQLSGRALDFKACLPTFPGVDVLYHSPLRPSLWEANRLRALELGAPTRLPPVAFDPQTSGGLLIAVPEALQERFCRETGAVPVATVC